MTPHPNDMTAWEEIRCQRGHTHHVRRAVQVDLFREHGYHDYPQVPTRLGRHFIMAIWDWNDDEYCEPGPYCPAHDAVSQTIEQLGIWEPCETIITLAAMTAADPDSIFIDFGAQIGWFSLLAASTGHGVIAIEADPECMSIIKQNAKLNGLDDLFVYRQDRVGPMEPMPWTGPRVALAKIDVEGAEEHAVAMLWSAIEAGMVDHLLIEISPVFNDSYPDLVVRLLDVGYEAHLMPEKATPPVRFEQFPRDLERWTVESTAELSVREIVGGWHQHNVLFSHPGAPT